MKDIQSLLEIVVTKRYGFGTGVWPAINPKLKMEINEFGEYIPVINNENISFSEIEIEDLKKSASIFSENNETAISKSLFSTIPNIKFNTKIGYYLNLYVGHVVEDSYRKEGSSGGFGTWILTELLEKKHVDYVIHVKESDKSDKLFEYSISETVDEIRKGSRTKYYPVELSEVLEIVKKKPGKYALVGLPAYIMDVRLLSKIDPIIKERIKFTIGLVCGHQKSTFFGEFLAWQCGIKPGDLRKINFRKKLEGIPAYSYAIEVEGEIDGKPVKIVKKMKELLGADWGQGLFKVRASDFTDDVMNETADLTLGDAWLPGYADESEGNNILVVRSPEISDIIKQAIVRKDVKLDIVDEKTIVESQLGHYRHTQDELAYRLYKKDREKEWRPKTRVVASNRISSIRKKIQNKREEICLEAPGKYREAVEKNDIDFFINYINPVSKSYKKIYKVESIQNRIVNKLKKILK